MNNFNYKQLDEIIHSRIRLAIMASLISVESATFVFLKEQVNTTDGNLSIHLKKLVEVKYISINKKFVKNKPLTTIKLTIKGKTAFMEYINKLEKMINLESK